MTEIQEKFFIQKIKINKLRHLKNLEINLSETEKKHLIITGKNGSGKTSLLEDLSNLGIMFNKSNYQNFHSKIERSEIFVGGITVFLNKFKKFNKITNKFIFACFEANKHILKLEKPTGIEKLEKKKYYNINQNANTNFIQYLVNLKAERSFARDDNEIEIVEKIDKWFHVFTGLLKEIFEDENLKLEFDRKNYNFNIVLPNREKFDLNTLSDGYASVMNIVTELIARMENNDTKNYDLQGIVLIDEIETHLHINLQKNILPFLTKVFPEIQFIVTTHSPFILNSLENAVIYDLENQERITDLSAYSVDGIIEAYFNVDKYSNHLKNLIREYENLINLDTLNEKEKERFKYLKNYFKDVSKFMSDELTLKLQQLDFLNLEKEH